MWGRCPTCLSTKRRLTGAAAGEPLPKPGQLPTQQGRRTAMQIDKQQVIDMLKKRGSRPGRPG